MHGAVLVAQAPAAHRAAAATTARVRRRPPAAVARLRARPPGGSLRDCSSSAASVASEMPPSGAQGSIRRAYRASQRTTLPMPAATPWSSSTSPTGRARGERARARSRATAIRGSSSSRSGPRSRRAGWRASRARSSTSSTGPPNCTAPSPHAPQLQPRACAASPPRRSLGIDVPRAGHAQVGVHDAAARELQEQVLAAGAHRLEHAAVQRLGEAGRRLWRVRAHLDGCADEWREP